MADFETMTSVICQRARVGETVEKAARPLRHALANSGSVASATEDGAPEPSR